LKWQSGEVISLFVNAKNMSASRRGKIVRAATVCCRRKKQMDVI